MILVVLASILYAAYYAIFLTGTFGAFFGLHLNALGVFDGIFYGRNVLGKLGSHLRTEAMRWGTRRVVVWMAGAAVYTGALVWSIVTFSTRRNDTADDRVLYSLLCAQALATLYAPWYYDHSELTGTRNWTWLRELRLWRAIASGLFKMEAYHVQDGDVLKCRPPHLFWRRDRHCWREGMRHANGKYCMSTANVVDWHAHSVASHSPHRVLSGASSENADAGADVSRIYAMHPHGLSTVAGIFGAAMYGPADGAAFPGARRIRLCVARVLLWVPVLRDWCLWCGCLEASHLAIHINTKVNREHDLVILPGGLMEQALSRPGHLDVVWQRTGFVRAALLADMRVVPVCVMGESYTYATLPHLAALRLFLYRLCGIPLPSPFLGPIPTPLTIVVGLDVVPRVVDPAACPEGKTHTLQSEVQARLRFLTYAGGDDDGEGEGEGVWPSARAVQLMRTAIHADFCDLYMLSMHSVAALRGRDGCAIEAPGPSMRKLMHDTKRDSDVNEHIMDALARDVPTHHRDTFRWRAAYRRMASTDRL